MYFKLLVPNHKLHNPNKIETSITRTNMFSVIEFRENDGGGISIVNSKWLTPRKQEVYWPPIKDNLKFEKVIRKVEQEVDSTWKLYPVERIFYTSGKFH